MPGKLIGEIYSVLIIEEIIIIYVGPAIFDDIL